MKSHHAVSDISRIKNELSSSELMVRINPWNVGSTNEINAVIDAGADVIMLPMWKTVNEVKLFLDSVGKRAHTNLLLETKEAINCLDEVLKLDGIDEIHIGLNDLHLSYGMTFMFEVLSDGIIEKTCKKISSYGIPYGFGGIAKLGYGDLPAERIITEHYRLGSSAAILSRSFCNYEEIHDVNVIDDLFRINMKALREFEIKAAGFSEEEFENNRKEVCRLTSEIVKKRRER